MDKDPKAEHAISETASVHIKNLIDDGKTEYKAFDLLAGLDRTAPDYETIRKALVNIVEINIFQELKQADEIYKTAEDLLKQDDRDIPMMFEHWHKCLEAAAPNRSAMKELCSNFPTFVPALPKDIVKRYLELAREILEHHKRKSLNVVLNIAANLVEIDSPENGLDYLNFLFDYIPDSTTKIIGALANIAKILIENPDPTIKESFSKLFTPELLYDDSSADKFISDCGGMLEKATDKYRGAYFQMCFRAAVENFGSASYVAGNLPKKVDDLDERFREAYVDSFQRILDEVGIAAVGFCFRSLNQLVSGRSADDVQRFVDAVCEIASRFGTRAAMSFLEQKTPTSRSFWSE